MTTASFPTRKLSAIVACYHDEQATPIMAERLEATFKKIGVDYEIIFVTKLLNFDQPNPGTPPKYAANMDGPP